MTTERDYRTVLARVCVRVRVLHKTSLPFKRSVTLSAGKNFAIVITRAGPYFTTTASRNINSLSLRAFISSPKISKINPPLLPRMDGYKFRRVTGARALLTCRYQYPVLIL